MTQTTVTTTLAGNAQPTGSAPHAGSAEEAGFAASMTAVLTINVSDEDDETQGASTEESAESSSDDIEIEIEITTFEGDGLLENLSVTSNRGTAEISITTDGDVGVSTDGIFFSDNPEVQMGETLTFTVPTELGEAQGATITVSNLVDDETGAESALVIAYDAEGNEVLRCLVEGDESGDVTVDIDVSFSKIDFKPVDNGSWTLSGNSDFTIERIDIRMGDAPERDSVQHNWSGFLNDFRSFFEDRNFRLQKSIHGTYHQSATEIFATRPPTDHRHADEAARRDLDQQNQAAMHAVQDRN